MVRMTNPKKNQNGVFNAENDQRWNFYRSIFIPVLTIQGEQFSHCQGILRRPFCCDCSSQAGPIAAILIFSGILAIPKLLVSSVLVCPWKIMSNNKMVDKVGSFEIILGFPTSRNSQMYGRNHRRNHRAPTARSNFLSFQFWNNSTATLSWSAASQRFSCVSLLCILQKSVSMSVATSDHCRGSLVNSDKEYVAGRKTQTTLHDMLSDKQVQNEDLNGFLYTSQLGFRNITASSRNVSKPELGRDRVRSRASSRTKSACKPSQEPPGTNRTVELSVFSVLK